MADGCRVQQSGFGTSPFQAIGESLVVSMDRVDGTFDEPAGVEEMVAIVEGSATVNCGDEQYRLVAGTGLLIAAGLRRHWTIDGEAVIYRVKVR